MEPHRFSTKLGLRSRSPPQLLGRLFPPWSDKPYLLCVRVRKRLYLNSILTPPSSGHASDTAVPAGFIRPSNWAWKWPNSIQKLAVLVEPCSCQKLVPIDVYRGRDPPEIYDNAVIGLSGALPGLEKSAPGVILGFIQTLLICLSWSVESVLDMIMENGK